MIPGFSLACILSMEAEKRYKKNRKNSGFFFLTAGKAVAAVYWSAISRLERHLGLGAAFSTDSSVHFTISASALTALAGTAVIAATGLIGEALLCVEFLFSCGENEFASAVTAGQGLVGVAHLKKPPLLSQLVWQPGLNLTKE